MRNVIAIVSLLGTLVFAGSAVAQEPPPGAVPDSDALTRDVLDRAAMQDICWELGEARTVDWIAERDPGFAREVMARYLLEEIEGGWRWLPAELATRTDVRSSDRAEGYGSRVLEVRLDGKGGGAATLAVDGALAEGEASFAWTPPPDRLCMIDQLDLEASAAVESGNPGSHRIGFVLPLAKEQLEVRDAGVKACSPGAQVGIDPESGLRQDSGQCRRALTHLPVEGGWELWVSLPEAFYVVYPYEPTGR